MPERILTVRVARITPHTADISAFELVHAHAGALPAYAAGAHIDVHTPGGFKRAYSLAEAAPQDGRVQRYLIAVKHEAGGAGGSAAMHRNVRAGDLLAISTPRHHFALQAQAQQHLLLAGGIGLTPLLAMAQQLKADGAQYTLCVFARSPAQLAFGRELEALAPQVQFHFDTPATQSKLDLACLLARRPEGAHLYLCGPSGFMQAARQAATSWPDSSVHLEHFAVPAGQQAAASTAAFELQLLRRGLRVAVRADQTAVQALAALGIAVPTSCEQGLCGSCVVGWQAADDEGEPEHRDFCLSDPERRSRVALCCSRAARGTLAIEL